MKKLALMKPKCIFPIKVPKNGSKRIIKPLTRPIYEVTVRPDAPEMTLEICGEFDSDSNIFNVQTEDNKQKRPNTKEYHLTKWGKADGFRIEFEE